MDAVLLSIKPRFADEILLGVKRFELRAGSGIRSGYRVVLYASSPVKAIVGEFMAGRVVVGMYNEVIKFVNSIPWSGVSDEDISYVYGKKRKVMAIEILNPIKYYKFITLETLRRLGLKNPPRSYLFLNTANNVHRKIIEVINNAVKCLTNIE